MCKLAGATVVDGVTFAASCAAPSFNLGTHLFRSRLLAGAVGVSNAVIRFTYKPIVVVFMVCDRIDQVLLKESVFGSDVLTCSSCQHHTRKCTSCSDGFAWGNGILNSLQCAVCVGCLRSWSCLESPAVSEVSAICSWCLQKSFHHLIEKNTFRRSVYGSPQPFSSLLCF
jgi:hypothetical protein